MILASYNVENLFQCAVAMNQDSMAVGRDVLENVEHYPEITNV